MSVYYLVEKASQILVVQFWLAVIGPDAGARVPAFGFACRWRDAQHGEIIDGQGIKP
jgi:hypothetical protein